MVKKMKKSILQLFIFILSFAIWCNFGLAADGIPDYWPTRGWRSASPESQGVDSNLLENMQIIDIIYTHVLKALSRR